MIRTASGPFTVTRDLLNWRSEPHWPAPALPAEVLTVGRPPGAVPVGGEGEVGIREVAGIAGGRGQ